MQFTDQLLESFDVPDQAMQFLRDERLGTVGQLLDYDLMCSDDFVDLPSTCQLQLMSLKYDLANESQLADRAGRVGQLPPLGAPEKKPAERLYAVEMVEPAEDREEDVLQGALSRFRQQLLDLSAGLGNHLLNFRETKSTIRIVDELPEKTFEYLVPQLKTMRFLPVPDVVDEVDEETGRHHAGDIDIERELPLPGGDDVAERHVDDFLQTDLLQDVLERRLRKLRSDANMTVQETGTNLLHLAIGFVDWCKPDEPNKLRRAPILLVPVEIKRGRLDRFSRRYEYTVEYSGEDIEPCNLSLRELLDHDHDLVLPEFDAEAGIEDYIERVRSVIALKEGWGVGREMVIGFFSHTKILMYRDLMPDAWGGNGSLEERAVLKLLLGGEQPEEAGPVEERIDIDRDPRADSVSLVLDADSSQHAALVHALEGKNLVIHGPPGTGKSQTITNLIAAAMEAGKSVLFVSEKLAALEVVRGKLDGLGLGDFCLELHSAKVQKRQVLADLRSRLGRTYASPAGLAEVQHGLRRAKDALNAYVERMQRTVGPLDEPLWAVLGRVDNLRQGLPSELPEVTVDGAMAFSRDDIETRLSTLNDIGRHLRENPGAAENAWRGFYPRALLPGDQEQILGTTKELLDSLTRLKELMDTARSDFFLELPANIETLKAISAEAISALPVPPEALVQPLVGCTEPAKLASIDLLGAMIEESARVSRRLEEASGVLPHVSKEALPGLPKFVQECGVLDVDKLSVAQVAQIQRTAEGMADALKQIGEYRAELQQILPIFESLDTLDAFRRAHAVAEFIVSQPVETFGLVGPEMLAPSSGYAHQQLTDEWAQMDDLRQSLDGVFVMESLPEPGELEELAQTFRTKAGGFFALFSGDLRRARRIVAGFSQSQGVAKDKNVAEHLARAARYQAIKKGLDDNQHYVSVFGPLYRGTKTDFDLLGRAVQFSKRFVEAARGPERAAKLMGRLAQAWYELPAPVGKATEALASLKEHLENLPSDAEGTEVGKELPGLEFTQFVSAAERLAKAGAEASRLIGRFQWLANRTPEQLDEILKLHGRLAEIADEAEGQKVGLEWLGDFYAGLDTAWEPVAETMAWCQGLAERDLIPGLANWLLERDTLDRFHFLGRLYRDADDINERVAQLLMELRAHGDVDRKTFLGFEAPDATFGSAQSKLRACLESSASLGQWGQYTGLVNEARELGCGDIVDAVERRLVTADEAGTLFEYVVYNGVGKAALRSDKDLQRFRRVTHERIQEEFRDLDKKLLELSRAQIAAQVSRRKVPSGNAVGKVRDYTELSLIRHELSKKTRHIPVRQLVLRAPKALVALKPCFMMSPLSVAKYLPPGDIEFDMVVMDEASQIQPQDSLGALARGKQLVVVGDPKQLPPTTFFARIENQEDEEEAVAAELCESILDVAERCYRSKELQWHYRSRHESLIDFSNKHFYDGNLVVFPSPHPDNEALGVRHHYVEGATYTGGRSKRVNRVEAQRVAEAVIEHMVNRPHETLCVATFNRNQRDVIEDWVEKLMKDFPRAGRVQEEWEGIGQPFFVKNLENIQGDERDVVFISTTYGPDNETGKVQQRFGPIAGPTGWRRLNVLVTRARLRVEVFTSMRSGDIRGGPESSRGVRALRDYLYYAENGRHKDHGTITGREPDSPFEVAVGRAIQSLGYEVEYQVGVAGFFVDIGVYHPDRPGEFLLGVECDGATYHSSLSARDRDRLRQEVLENLGWRIHRIWSTDWFLNRDTEVERLGKKLQKAVQAAELKSRSVPPPVVVAPALEELTEPPAGEASKPKGDVARPSAPPRPQKPKEEAAPVEAPAPAFEKTHEQRRDEIRRLLIAYRENSIKPTPEERKTGILRKEMLSLLVEKQPTDRKEFYALIPREMRENVGKGQGQYLDDILDIIEEVVFGA